jgi:cell division septation protein DedD
VDTIEANAERSREAVLADPVPGGDSTINPPPMPNTNEQGLYSIQVGFFENEKNADALTEKLKNKGYDAFMQWHVNENNKTVFRVFVGRYHDKTEAVEQAQEIRRREGLKSVGIG